MNDDELTRLAVEELLREAREKKGDENRIVENKINPLGPNKRFLDRTLNAVLSYNKRESARTQKNCRAKLKDLDDRRRKKCKHQYKERDKPRSGSESSHRIYSSDSSRLEETQSKYKSKLRRKSKRKSKWKKKHRRERESSSESSCDERGSCHTRRNQQIRSFERQCQILPYQEGSVQLSTAAVAAYQQKPFFYCHPYWFETITIPQINPTSIETPKSDTDIPSDLLSNSESESPPPKTSEAGGKKRKMSTIELLSDDDEENKLLKEKQKVGKNIEKKLTKRTKRKSRSKCKKNETKTKAPVLLIAIDDSSSENSNDKKETKTVITIDSDSDVAQELPAISEHNKEIIVFSSDSDASVEIVETVEKETKFK